MPDLDQPLKSERKGGNNRSRSRSRDRDLSRAIPSEESKSGGNADRRSNGPVDPSLPSLNDDPRVDRFRGKIANKKRGGGRNTESFDPASTLVRPDMRIVIGPNREVLNKPLKHDDVVVVPEFFCAEDDWSIYYDLVKEMREAQNEKVQGLCVFAKKSPVIMRSNFHSNFPFVFPRR